MYIEDRVREILCDITGKDFSALSSKQDLNELGVSSMAMIQLIVILEGEFNCQVPINRLNLYELDSIERVAEVFALCIKGKENESKTKCI